ncbi:TP901 family phage tail tape measure protein [Bradyrhizobium japonicum]|nr:MULTISPECIES: phage tail tape measure protein [Bradyrhizobium]MBR0879350.1 phage tail tape measure protein [Bradyrhizobium liaoningense]MBR0999898.1 phage tail tape measure protein [Bradyrhizobium liaoningense]MBR1069533.1 phage tail tape measure protein [Bradyrhizobium liaoningense]MCP1740662.1 TP901 family phage tail tape measure protein [Bradyrhizobium japonicum]MCP1889151.1 TP901 family phage tail tape measure protein [Bradyrhizobium japonicum]
MSDETLHVSVTLSATESASPVLRGLMKNIDALRASARRFNAEFSSLGKTAFQSLDGVTRASKSAADSMRGLTNVAERAAASYRSAWTKADQDREKSASRMYGALMRDERAYQALLGRRGSAGASPSRGSGTSVGKIAGGTFLGVGAASAVRQLSHDVVAAERSIGRGIASAFRERLNIAKSETNAEMFADLSSEEVRKLRKESLDRLGIKFGVGAEGTLGVATELSKAGIGKQVLGDATELALKAKTAMDISAKETAELFGGLASFIQFDKNRYASISNSIAIANKDSKATGTQIVEGMKRGLSALATTGGKLTPEQLAGLVGTAIDVGIQPGKSGNFISHLIGGVGSADTMHGQKAKDMQEAAAYLGFGGRYEMAQAMRNNPLASVYQLLDHLSKLPEKLRIRVAKDLGGEMWFDEILQLVLAKDKLKQIEQDIATDKGFLDKAALKAVRSMSGAYASVVAAAKLAQEKIGGGFDKAFTQIADAILRHADTFNFDSIRDHFEALTDGLLQGFGLKNWGQAVDWLAGQFSPSTIASWKAWGRGFAAGIKSWGESLMSAFSIVRRLTGSDPESTGKLVANLAVLATSLIVINPLLLLLAGTMALLSSPFALFIASVVALKKTLDWVADKMFTAFVSIVDAIKNVALSMINKVRGWIGLSPIGGEGTDGGHGASGSWTDGSSGSGASGSWDSTAKKVRSSFTNSVPSFNGSGGVAGSLDKASFDRKFAGTALAGKYDQIVAAANANGIPPALLAGVIAHETGNGANTRYNNVAGLMNPETGSRTKLAFPSIDAGIDAAGRTVAKNYNAAGRDLGAMAKRYAPVGATNDPGGLNSGWQSGVSKQMNVLSGGVGSAGAGDAVSAGEKYLGMNEYSDAKVLASYLGADVRGQSNAWCSRFVNRALADVGGKGTGSAVANSFQKWGSAINPSDVRRNDVLLQTHGLGYNQPGGHVGLATGETRMRNGRLQIKMLAGNDGDAVRERWIDADRNLMVRRGNPISQVPTPADAIQNVPAAPQSGVPMRGDFGGAGRGSVAIHINGNSHDPEALANLVQRRVDEQMNWRTHDSESEYT